MSWEYSKYEAHCESCGRQGVCIKGSDDWNRFSTEWEGFENVEASATAVARQKADRRQSLAVCSCGNSKIVVGKHISDI